MILEIITTKINKTEANNALVTEGYLYVIRNMKLTTKNRAELIWR
jgi:hypothetical protein